VKSLKFALLLFLAITNIAHAEQSTFGEADKSVAALSQFEYLRGEWEVSIQARQDDGSFKLLKNKASVRGFYHQDGRSFQTIFSTVSGGFTTDIRSYNLEENKWQILFMNATAQRWHKFEASLIDGIMVTYVAGGYSGREEYDVRIIDKDITDAHFIKEVFHSRNNGESWQKIYIMNFSRIK